MCMVQEHAVWKNQQFWEAAYYQDVQKDIKSLYSNIADGPLHSHPPPVSPSNPVREVSYLTLLSLH